MIDIDRDLAVQSYCYRGFKDVNVYLEKVRQSGITSVEICGVHVKVQKPETFKAVLEAHRQAGVKIVSYGVHRLGVSEAEDRAACEFCKAAGARHMSIDFLPDNFRTAHEAAQKLADEYDLRMGIHNHGGYHWLGSKQILEHVFSIVGPRIGLCLDTAWALHSHEDPVKLAEKFADRLTGVHLKDFTFNRDGSFADAIVGTGNLNLPALKAVLEKAKFAGPLVLEFEGNVDNPVPEVQRCVANIKAQFKA